MIELSVCPICKRLPIVGNGFRGKLQVIIFCENYTNVIPHSISINGLGKSQAAERWNNFVSGLPASQVDRVRL